MIQAKISGLEKLAMKLRPQVRDNVIKSSLTKGAFYLQNWIQRRRLTGPRPGFLGVVSGRLRASISVQTAQKSGNNYVAKIGTNVVYAAIHEFGGRTGRGKGFMMKPRPFMQPAIDDLKNRKFILTMLTRNIQRALDKA